MVHTVQELTNMNVMSILKDDLGGEGREEGRGSRERERERQGQRVGRVHGKERVSGERREGGAHLAMRVIALTAVSRVISFLSRSTKMGMHSASLSVRASPIEAITWPL